MSVRALTLFDMKVSCLPRSATLPVTRAGSFPARKLSGPGSREDMIKFRIRSGRWRQLHPGVYATFTGGPGHAAQLWAAVLAAGPGAMLSYETAAELLRLS